MNRIGKAFVSACVLAVLGLALADPRITALADTLIRGSQIKPGTVTSTQLNTSGVTAASYGSGTAIPSFTVDAAGRLTAASSTSISASLLPASVTKGNVIGASGSAWSTLAVGTDGQVLTADAASTLGIKWAAGGGGGGGGTGGTGAVVLIEQHTASSSATLDFPASITSTYDNYVIELVNILPATDNVDLLMQCSTNGGSSYDSGSNYDYATYIVNTSGSFSTNSVASSSATGIKIAPTMDNGSSTGGANATLDFINPLNASQHKTTNYRMSWFNNDNQLYSGIGSGRYKSTTACNAVRFVFSSGNIASGVIRVYGVTKATGTGSMGSVLMEQHTASSSATLDFTSCFTTAYDTYRFEYVDIVPATNATLFMARLSSDGGATFNTTAANYRWYLHYFGDAGDSGVVTQSTGGAITTAVEMAGTVANTSTEGVVGWMQIYDPMSTTNVKNIVGETTFRHSNTNMYRMNYGASFKVTGTAQNAMRFMFDSGNIATGTIRCYAISK